jgi:hypothetical protein
MYLGHSLEHKADDEGERRPGIVEHILHVVLLGAVGHGVLHLSHMRNYY